MKHILATAAILLCLGWSTLAVPPVDRGFLKDPGQAVLSSLQLLEKELVKKCKDSKLKATWSEYKAAQDANSGILDYATVTLYQDDFSDGTLVVKRPVCLYLAEDVELAPNKENDYLPRPGQEPFYSSDAFQLGFFAGLELIGTDIVLDFDGHSMKMSTDFLLMQRFFAIVETASAPFVPEQGPANFGPDVISCKRCIIKNGHLGASSHHGIHGNGNDQLFIHDMVAKDYEVAGITLGGATNTAVLNCELQGTRTKVWVDGTFSQARFATNTILQRVLTRPLETEAATELRKVTADLSAILSKARNQILASGTLTTPDTIELFQNAPIPNGQQVIDGTSYGLSLNILGAITNDFLTASSNRVGELANVTVQNVKIANTLCQIEEVVGLRQAPGSTKPNVGMQHELFRITEWVDDGMYKPNAVAEFNLKLLELSDKINGTSAYLKTNNLLKEFSMSYDVLQWARGQVAYNDLISNRLMCNLDTQGHTLKGNIGLFISGGEGVYVTDVTVANTANYGKSEHVDICQANDPTFTRYNGADSHGVVVVASQGVSLKRVTVDGVTAGGKAYGIRIFNGAQKVCLTDVNVSGAGQPGIVVDASSSTTTSCA